MEAAIKKEHNGTTPHVISDHVAAKCMQKICNQFDPNFEVQINKEIAHMSELPPMGATSHQRPDGVALNDCLGKKVSDIRCTVIANETY